MPLLSLKNLPSEHDQDLLFFSAAGNPAGQSGDWLASPDEGQLAVDVLENDIEITISSPIAGVQPEDLEVFVHNDMLTIRGTRQMQYASDAGRFIVRECHWGAFSRSILLPSEVDSERITATLKNGILTVRLPKTERSKKIAVKKV